MRDDVEQDLHQRLDRLDLEAKVKLLTGETYWRTYALPQIGLRQMVVSDGPVGVRGERWDERDLAAAVPSPTALAASWDPALVERVATLLAAECHRKSIDVLLAPTVNLHRSPLGGRHFECYSEDPLLTTRIGAAYVDGLQRHGIGACVKHFVGNDSETDRMTVDVRIPDDALHELYLAPFERIITATRPWSIMAGYNSLDGTTMTEHDLLDLPRERWDFDGAVISDWTATRSTAAAATAALDLAMPGPDGPWGEQLVRAVHEGTVPEAAIDAKVLRLLRLAARVGALDGIPPAVTIDEQSPAPDAPVMRDLLREAAAAGMVLLRNQDGVLPLQVGSVRRIAVLGPSAAVARSQGGGSAAVFPPHAVSPLDGLRHALGEQVQVTHTAGVHLVDGVQPVTSAQVHDPVNGEPGLRLRFLDADGAELANEHRLSGRLGWMGPAFQPGAAAVELEAVLNVDVGGQWALGFAGVGPLRLELDGKPLLEEDVDPPPGHEFETFMAPARRQVDVELAEHQQAHLRLRYHPRDVEMVAVELCAAPPRRTATEELELAVEQAAEADVAIVVVGTTEHDESEGFDRGTLALPGGQDELVDRVAAANPRTIVVVNSGAPVLLPWRERVPAVLLTWFGGQELGDALADVLLGEHEPGGRLPTTWPGREQDCPVLSTTPVDGVLAYDEGTLIGYRGWHAQIADGGPEPAFWFGHGLGYTSWELADLAVAGGAVQVKVRNTGERPGRQLVQVYVSREGDPGGRVLAGFGWAAAEPGAGTELEITLDEQARRRWDGGWHQLTGEVEVSAACSAGEVGPSVRTRLGQP